MNAPLDRRASARQWLNMTESAGLRPLRICGKTLLPIVQGGMGVGVSASGLASAVARLGGMGTISSVDLRRRHTDLMAQTAHLDKEPDARERINAANLHALDREIRTARQAARGQGWIAVNVMKALSAYAAYVQQALQSGADALVVGAGLPLDLPELAREHPHVALIPILSDARGVQLLVRKWEKKGRLPDAIVIEHPRLAGGHLGAAQVADLNDGRFDFEVVIPQVREFFKQAGYERDIPLIAAGGINSHADIARLQGLGAAGVQLGTAFAVTEECDASEVFKRILAQARPQDIVEFTSVAGLPARAVRTPWLDKYLRILPILQERAHRKARCNMSFDCLQTCGLRDGLSGIGQFCIDQQLGHAMDGDADRGLFFRGTGRLPFGEQIRGVADLVRHLLTPAPLGAA
ncbi:MAG: nitronate monooxygenase family protein [Limnohabitans sp.]|jgi:nitronate monooxygenase|uniref:NAD(P)H-dependent flavin oxidoreductase n=1 Tax=Limnohabitans sp. TaxID=1907725 RepID=UPI0030E1FE78